SEARIRRKVDFPAPLGPNSATNSPLSTCRFSPSSTGLTPKRFTSPRTSIMLIPSPGFSYRNQFCSIFQPALCAVDDSNLLSYFRLGIDHPAQGSGQEFLPRFPVLLPQLQPVVQNSFFAFVPATILPPPGPVQRWTIQ